MKRTKRVLIPLFIALAVAAPLVVMALSVDDWSRDLSTNRAATDPGAGHPLMRPITQRFTVEQLDTAIDLVCADQPQWSLPADEKPRPINTLIPNTDGEPIAVRHLVRTTGLMRYRDDVWLVVTKPTEQPDEGGDVKLRLNVESRSRIGKGDLGQNPRNIRELNELMLSRLIVKAPPPTAAR